MKDESIIELFFARSEKALSELQTKYGRLCGRIAYNILENAEDADEAVNAAYQRVWNAIPPARPKSLCGYLCVTVRNTAINALNKLRRGGIFDELSEVISDERTVEGEFDSRQISTYINEFLSKSSAKNSDIFVSRYYFNMTLAEIARAVGLSESAVKMRLMRMRSGLRKYLAERGVDV